MQLNKFKVEYQKEFAGMNQDGFVVYGFRDDMPVCNIAFALKKEDQHNSYKICEAITMSINQVIHFANKENKDESVHE